MHLNETVRARKSMLKFVAAGTAKATRRAGTAGGSAGCRGGDESVTPGAALAARGTLGRIVDPEVRLERVSRRPDRPAGGVPPRPGHRAPAAAERRARQRAGALVRRPAGAGDAVQRGGGR